MNKVHIETYTGWELPNYKHSFTWKPSLEQNLAFYFAQVDSFTFRDCRPILYLRIWLISNSSKSILQQRPRLGMYRYGQTVTIGIAVTLPFYLSKQGEKYDK